MRRLTVTIATLLAGAVFAAPAAAQSPFTATLSPDTPHTGATLAFTLSGSELNQGQYAGKTPKTVSVQAPAGLTIDPEAVATLCDSSQAASQSCPAGSQIGSGTASLTATYFGMSLPLNASLQAFLGSAGSVYVVASADGVQVTIDGSITNGSSGSGPVLQFTVPSTVEGASAQVNSLSLSAAGHHAVTTTRTVLKRRTVTVRVHGHERKVKRVKRTTERTTVDHQLITTPPTCPGSWTALGDVTFTDGTTASQTITIPCSS